MPREIPQVEPVARIAPYAAEEETGPWLHSPRVRLFALIFIAVLTLGVILTALQPARFQASATVLMTAPVAIDEREQSANVQDVAIQRRILLGGEVTQRLAQLQLRRREGASAADRMRALQQRLRDRARWQTQQSGQLAGDFGDREPRHFRRM